MAETVRRARLHVLANRDASEQDPLPAVNVQLAPSGSTWYNAPAATIVLAGGTALDDGVILHEYGHYVHDRLSTLPWIASVHNGCTATDALGNNIESKEHAWLEGFASGFAESVALADTAAGFRSSPLRSDPHLPCGSLPAGVTGDEVARNVADALHDLLDATNEAGDALSRDTMVGGTRLDALILGVLDRELDVPSYSGIMELRSALLLRGVNAQALDAILNLNGIPTATPGPVTKPPPDKRCGKVSRTTWCN